MSMVRAAKKALRNSGLQVEDASADENDLHSMSLVELRERVRELGLPVSGNKGDLVSRLEDHARGVHAPSPRGRSRSPRRAAASPRNTNSQSPRRAASPINNKASPKASPKAAKSPGTKKNDEEKETVEFGGPIGAAIILIGSHLTLYYLWISWKFYNAALLYPAGFSDIVPWLRTMLGHITSSAMPNREAFAIYWTFLFGQAFLAWIIPGLKMRGLPIKHLGGLRLEYNCNGIFTWYLTLLALFVLNYTGIWRLSSVYHNFGPLMTVSILTVDAISILLYISAFISKTTHRLTGNVMYDFFMGASLNPRIGPLDLKMFFETRVAWIMLFGLTASAAAHQYETLGYITPQMWFMILAHFIYTNAVHKGEECICTTWDIFYEKFGWMLVFWNGAGVPYVYCFQSWFIATHLPSEISIPNWAVVALAVWLLTAYYIWDVAQKQRNSFRMKLNGTWVERKTFPQFSAGVLPDNARAIKTKSGSLLLVDGLWKYARKLHYTADIAMAFSWGIVCGFTHALPYFYVTFFIIMITHRTLRDLHRCEAKYGDDWTRYKAEVPYLFIPYVI